MFQPISVHDMVNRITRHTSSTLLSSLLDTFSSSDLLINFFDYKKINSHIHWPSWLSICIWQPTYYITSPYQRAYSIHRFLFCSSFNNFKASMFMWVWAWWREWGVLTLQISLVTIYLYLHNKRKMTINIATMSDRLHLPSRRTKVKVPQYSLIYRREKWRHSSSFLSSQCM